MSWLARLDVDKEILFNEGIAENIYSWHKALWSSFPNQPETERDFLTRIDPLEGKYRFWLLSKERKPVCPQWCPSECFMIKEIAPTFLAHRFYAFDLKVNPVKTKVIRGPNGETLKNPDDKRKHGKRIPITKQDELKSWLVRKGEIRCIEKGTQKKISGGFRIVEDKSLEISPMVESYFSKDGHEAYHGGVQFRGILEVTNQESFIDTYYSGIGSAKGFGFGLLLLAPVKR